MIVLNALLLLQAVDTVVVNVPVSDNTGRRDVLLSIIAAAVTITITLGPILINRWMDKLKDEREAAAKIVADAAAVVAAKVEEVKKAAAETGIGIQGLQKTADATHILVDGRYSEIREELKRSNENNQRMTQILTKAGIIAPAKPEPSGVVAEPDSERRVGEPDRREGEEDA